MSVILIHEMFLVYNLETFTNCEEVKHIMVMIIAIIYIFFNLMTLFDQQLKIIFRKSSAPYPSTKKKKIHSPVLLPPPLKIQKLQLPPFLPTLKFLQVPPAERGGGMEDTMIYLERMVSFFPILD